MRSIGCGYIDPEVYVIDYVDYIGCIMDEESEVHRFMELATGDIIRIALIDGKVNYVTDENLS